MSVQDPTPWRDLARQLRRKAVELDKSADIDPGSARAEVYREIAAMVVAISEDGHTHYVWRHGVNANGGRWKQCDCGLAKETSADQNALELAKREFRDVIP